MGWVLSPHRLDDMNKTSWIWLYKVLVNCTRIMVILNYCTSKKKQCLWWCEIMIATSLKPNTPFVVLFRSLFGPLFKDSHPSAPPSPCCSFARYLVGKMVIRYILICSTLSTAQLVFFLLGPLGHRNWQIAVPCLFTTLSLQQILVNGRNNGCLVDKYPNEWTWTMDAYDARLLQKNPKDLLPPTSRPSLITSQRLSVTFFFSNPFYHPLRHGMHSAIGILESFWWPRLSRFAAESVYLGDPTYRNGTDRKTLPIIKGSLGWETSDIRTTSQ